MRPRNKCSNVHAKSFTLVYNAPRQWSCSRRTVVYTIKNNSIQENDYMSLLLQAQFNVYSITCQVFHKVDLVLGVYHTNLVRADSLYMSSCLAQHRRIGILIILCIPTNLATSVLYDSLHLAALVVLAGIRRKACDCSPSMQRFLQSVSFHKRQLQLAKDLSAIREVRCRIFHQFSYTLHKENSILHKDLFPS